MRSDNVVVGRLYRIVGIGHESSLYHEAYSTYRISPIGLVVTPDPLIFITSCDEVAYQVPASNSWAGDFVVVKGNTCGFIPGSRLSLFGGYFVDIGPVDPVQLFSLVESKQATTFVKRPPKKVWLY